VNRAWIELETLFSGQWPNGMVPHILFHQPEEGYFPGPGVWQGTGPIASSGISQPPVAATLARLIFERDHDEGTRRLTPLFDKFVAWHGWFMDWRLDRGAVCISHPWEAGRDNAPDWDNAMGAIEPGDVGRYSRRDTTHVDSAMRPTKWDYDRYLFIVQRGARLGWDEAAMLDGTPFRVADPTMTFTLLRAQRDLAELGRLLGRDVSQIEDWISVLEAGADTLWNDAIQAFDSRDTLSGEWANSVSNASFLAWLGGIDRPELRDTLARVLAGVRYGIPSLDAADARFDAKRYWRGPVWAVMNMLTGLGLRDCGLTQEAEDLRSTTADLIRSHGFAEYFDPRTGDPAGGKTFTWTAAVWLGWASTTAKVS